MKWLVTDERDGRHWVVGRLETRQDFFGRRSVLAADDTVAVSARMLFSLIFPRDGYAVDFPSRTLTIHCHDRVVRYDLVRYLPGAGFWIASRRSDSREAERELNNG